MLGRAESTIEKKAVSKKSTTSSTAYSEGLPYGKISKCQIRQPIKQQQGMTCTLYAMRRIAFFNTEDDKSVHAYKALKKGLSSYKHGSAKSIKNLIAIANKLIMDFKINMEQSINENTSFLSSYTLGRNIAEFSLTPFEMYQKLPDFHRWITLYSILLQKILLPLFTLQQAGWHPDKGIGALKESIKNNGAHFFMGKYGTWCHKQKPKEFTAECTADRQVLYFPKNSFTAGSSEFTHGIIVDQIKKIAGKDVVFYRDPNFPSAPGHKEKIFMLSYENFVNRLTDLRGLRYCMKECSKNESFGITSNVPEKIYRLS